MDDESPIPSEPILSEEETLKQLRDDFTKDYRHIITKQQNQISLLEKTICELREALTSNVETCSCDYWEETTIEEHRPTCSKIVARKALSLTPSEISEKWVKKTMI